MYQVKVFEGNGNNESDINNFLKDNPDIEVISVTHNSMHDLYYNITPIQICNQWIASTLIYKIKDN